MAADPPPHRVPHITQGAAKPLISGAGGLGKAGIGPASTGLGPRAVPPPHPHARQLFLEEATGLLDLSPDGPLMLMGARCGAETSTFPIWGCRRGGVSKYFRPRSLPTIPTALLLSVTCVPGSLGATELLYTPAHHKPPYFCSKCSLLSCFNRHLAHPWRHPWSSPKLLFLSLPPLPPRVQGGADPWGSVSSLSKVPPLKGFSAPPSPRSVQSSHLF